MSLLLAFPDESHFGSRSHSRFGGPRMCGGASRCGPGAYSCGGGSPRTQANSHPVRVVEDETGLLLIADLPGMSKKDVSIELKERVLRISTHPESAIHAHAPAAGSSSPRTPHRHRVHLHERPTPRATSVAFRLGHHINLQAIAASLEDGVLTIQLPFAVPEEPQARSIPVQGPDAADQAGPSHTPALQDAEGWVRVGGPDLEGKSNAPADAPVAEDHTHMDEAAHELEEKEEEDAVQTVVGGVAVEEHGEEQEEDGSIEDCEL